MKNHCHVWIFWFWQQLMNSIKWIKKMVMVKNKKVYQLIYWSMSGQGQAVNKWLATIVSNIYLYIYRRKGNDWVRANEWFRRATEEEWMKRKGQIKDWFDLCEWRTIAFANVSIRLLLADCIGGYNGPLTIVSKLHLVNRSIDRSYDQSSLTDMVNWRRMNGNEEITLRVLVLFDLHKRGISLYYFHWYTNWNDWLTLNKNDDQKN